MHKKFGEWLPTYETMHSMYPKKKKLTYFQMTEVEVATVFTMPARIIFKASCALNLLST